MAERHGVPGEWARVKGVVLGLWPLFIGIFVAGFAAALSLFAYPGIGAVAMVLALVFIYWSGVRGMRRVERFFKGAKGEEKVARILDTLPDGFHVFNDYLAGSMHVDHVVVGPSGIFSIETKCWAGSVTIDEDRVLVNGRLPSRSPLDQTLKESEQVRLAIDRLGWKGKVTPILAFASDNFDGHAYVSRSAVVLNSNELVHVLTAGTGILSENEVTRLVSFMEG